jgi:AraC-like DNA-binding protein
LRIQSSVADPDQRADGGVNLEAPPARRPTGRGSRPLFGRFRDEGLSVEWHDFEQAGPDEGAGPWADRVELCLNLSGEARISDGRSEVTLGPRTAAFYCKADGPLQTVRPPGQRHQFLAVGFSFVFLRRHLADSADSLHPLVRQAITARRKKSGVAPTARLTSRQQQLARSFRAPPVQAWAQEFWYRTKALELAAEFFFEPGEGEETFCQRQKRLASERAEKVVELLRRDLANPPPLEEIGRLVGCSPFHLSRTFSRESGMTIPQYLRQLRMERAAELLRRGAHNVTETALEVGYSSLSHFSLAFHQTFGCCPGLYPLATTTQKSAGIRRQPASAPE